MTRTAFLWSRLFRPGRGFLRALVGGGSMRLLNAAAGLAIAAIMARDMGPAGFGIYTLALSWVSILAIPSQLGLPTLIVREAAQAGASSRWGLLRGLLTRATQFTLCLSLLTAVALALAMLVGGLAAGSEFSLTLLIGALFVPIVSLGALRSAALRGLGRVIQGQLPDLLVRPLSFLVLLGISLAIGAELTPHMAMALHLAAAGVGFAIGVWLLVRALPTKLATADPVYDLAAWMRSLIPLSVVAGAQMINAQVGTVIVGFVGSPAEAGIYRAAVQASTSAMLPVTVVAMVAEPMIARALAEGIRDNLQRAVTQVSRAVLACVMPLALICALRGADLMALMFGDAFRVGGTILAVLCLAPLAAALVGSPEALINMSRNEGFAARLLCFALLLNAVLTATLTLSCGAIGAAWSIVLTSTMTTLAMAGAARRRVGVSVSPFVWRP